RDKLVTGVQTCALPIYSRSAIRGTQGLQGLWHRRDEGRHAQAGLCHGEGQAAQGLQGRGRLLLRTEERKGQAEGMSGHGERRGRSEERRVGKECRGGWE